MIEIIQNQDLREHNEDRSTGNVSALYAKLQKSLPPALKGEAMKSVFVLEDSEYDVDIYVSRKLTIRALGASKELTEAITKICPKVLLVSTYSK